MTWDPGQAEAAPPPRSRVRRRLSLLAGLLAVYLVAMFPLGCGAMLADKLMLFPSRGRIPAPGTTERLIETPVGLMHVVIARSAGEGVAPERFVVRFEGNASRAEYTAAYVADRWGDVPTEVWAMNHPGFGQSDGPARLDRLAPAALGVYDAMSKEAQGKPIFIDADSMGATQGLYVAAERQATRPVAGLVLKNPPPLRQIVMGRFGWWNLWLAAGPIAAGVPKELDAIANARRIRAPAIFIRSMRDEIVPVKYQQKIIDAYAGPKQIVEFAGADHNAPLDEVDDEIALALRKLTGGAPAGKLEGQGP